MTDDAMNRALARWPVDPASAAGEGFRAGWRAHERHKEGALDPNTLPLDEALAAARATLADEDRKGSERGSMERLRAAIREGHAMTALCNIALIGGAVAVVWWWLRRRANS